MRLLRSQDVATKFGIGETTLYRWIKEALIPKPFRIGGTNYWDESDLDAFISQHKEKYYGSRREAEVEAL